MDGTRFMKKKKPVFMIKSLNNQSCQIRHLADRTTRDSIINKWMDKKNKIFFYVRNYDLTLLLWNALNNTFLANLNKKPNYIPDGTSTTKWQSLGQAPGKCPWQKSHQAVKEL